MGLESKFFTLTITLGSGMVFPQVSIRILVENLSANEASTEATVPTNETQKEVEFWEP